VVVGTTLAGTALTGGGHPVTIPGRAARGTAPRNPGLVIPRASKRRVAWLAFVAAAMLAALVAAPGALAAPAAIEAKRAEVQAVLGELQRIDSELDKAVDAYNLATAELAAIEADVEATKRRLGIARDANRVAQQRLAARVLAIYRSGANRDETFLEILLGSGSLDEALDRADAADRISEEDQRILQDVRRAREGYRVQADKLREARAEQRRVVADRAQRRQEIEGRLADRQRLYNSVRDELERLEAEERERQELLAAEAARQLESSPSVSSGSISSAGGPTTTAVPGSRYGGVVGIAMQYLGVPYSWGGASPSGFDCSGFVMYVFAQVGVSLPHNAAAQYGYGVAVSSDQLQPGDLVFFDGLGHVGIYIGGGQFVHSPHSGDVVKISSLGDSWYASTYVGARRIL
jgi:peptidoglycan DL-endopeptidase CwlO